jgi:hypothetical protein
MVAVVPNPQQIRVPNTPIEQWVDDNGYPTPATQTFLYTLITSLQQNFGNEGLVAPSQPQDITTTPPTDNISIIQYNTVVDPTTSTAVTTLQNGTFLYDSTNKRMLVSIEIGGVPTFQELVLQAPNPVINPPI